MTRFTAIPRVSFGSRPDAAPAPLRTKEARRRMTQLAEARQALTVLPEPGEAVHCVFVGRFDLMDAVSVLVEKLGTVDTMTVATLAFARRNLTELLRLLDGGAVRRLTLLASKFFAQHNGDLWPEALGELRARGQRAAAARSHAKIVTLAAATGERIILESSANLRNNGSAETCTLFHDAALHDFHAGWIGNLVTAHEGDADDN